MTTGTFWGTVIFGSGEANQTTLVSTPEVSGGLQDELFVARFGPDGALQWVRAIRVDASHLNYEFGRNFAKVGAIAAINDGSFFVTGTLFAPTTFGSGETNQTTLLPFGDIENPPISTALFLARYAGDGTLLWARRDAPGVGTNQTRQDLAIAGDGSIYVTGTFSSTTTFGVGDATESTLTDAFPEAKMFLARYHNDGTLAWARSIRGGFGYGNAVAGLAGGSCVVTGAVWYDAIYGSTPVAGFAEPNQTSLTSAATSEAMFVAKYEVNGTLAWARQGAQSAAPGFTADSHADEIAAFADGSFALVGAFWGELTLGVGEPNQTMLQANTAIDVPDLYVARFDSDGHLLWAQRIAAYGAASRFYSVAAMAEGSLLVANAISASVVLAPGESGATTVAAGTLVGRYNANGSLAWAKSIPSAPILDTITGVSVATFTDGSCVVSSGVSVGQPTIGAGEPNATTLAAAPGLLLFRLRGSTTSLAAATNTDGTNPVTVAPTNAAEAGNSDIEVTFASVTAAGTTTAVVTNGAPTPPLPANFTLAGQPKCYEISTTAAYTAPIEVCIDYDENGIVDETALRLMHFEGGNWVDITTTLDTEANRICGETSSLSPFVLVLRPPVTIAATKSVISSFGGITTLLVETDGLFPVLSTTAGVLLGSPVDQGDGRHFTQDLQASPYATTATVTATAGAVQASVNVRFVPVDPALSSITVDPGTTYLGGQATITVTVRDQFGQPVAGIGPVVISTSLGVLSGGVTPVGNGTHTQLLMADAIGTAQLTAKIDGLPFDEPAALTVRDPAALGAVFGLDAGASAFPYATIQEAVNHVAADHLVHVFVSPGHHREIVKLGDIDDLVVEGLSGLSSVHVRGFRLDRCQGVTLLGFTVDAAGSGAAGITLAGGQNGNGNLSIVDCVVTNSARGQAGIEVGANHGMLLIDNCAVLDCGGNGIDLAQGGTFTINNSTITGNAWNGIAVDKAATAVIANCTITDNGKGGDSKRGYGILRQRAPGVGWPGAITLIANVLAENRGLVVPGRSDAQLGNYDQVIDPSDQQGPY